LGDLSVPHFYDLKLLKNTDKTKVMLFSNATDKTQNLPSIATSQGSQIEFVSCYRYLDILIDESLSFTPHIHQLAKRLKLKLGFYFRIKSCLSYGSKKRLVAATCLSVLDYGDVLYMHVSVSTCS